MEPNPVQPGFVAPPVSQPTPPSSDGAPAPQVSAPATMPTTADPFYTRIFAVGATALLGWMLYRILAPFLGPVAWALFIAFLLHPLHVRLTRQFRGRENLSAALLTLATFILLIGPLAALSAAFVSQSADVIQWIQE